jgi:hypothetical protein
VESCSTSHEPSPSHLPDVYIVPNTPSLQDNLISFSGLLEAETQEADVKIPGRINGKQIIRSLLIFFAFIH